MTDTTPLENWRVAIHGRTCYAGFTRYIDPFNIAIELHDAATHEDVAQVTINDGQPRPDDRILVKDYTENTGLPEILQRAGLIGALISDEPYAEYELLLRPQALVSRAAAAAASVNKT